MLFQFVFDNGSLSGAVPSIGGGFLPWIGILLLGVLVVGIAIMGVVTVFRSLQRSSLDGLDRKKLQAMWTEIEKTSDHGIMGAKLAVIEADKLLDTILRKMHFPGETMGERLKTAAYRYPNISQVWGAHKLRNQLVHDSTFEISIKQAKRAVNDFYQAIKTLNVM